MILLRNKKEMQRANKKLKEIFPICEVYQYMIPTYPSGHWFFGFASKKLHPVSDYNEEYYIWNNKCKHIWECSPESCPPEIESFLF